ncbi:MAG: PAS domain S-box protein [Acidobacteria bacterium]|nr:PAS domain S-box protein [Acidobacteriota bacterium]
MLSSDAKRIRVLMVDDDEDDFILTRCLFEEFRDNRYALEWTASASDALGHMAQREYDVYLVDFRLGAENGLDLVRAGIADGCQAPMILLTGQSEKEVDLDAMEAGAADYLVKGRFDAQLLERSIRYSIQQARSLRRVQSSEMKFRSVVQSASDAIFLVDGEGRVSLWNDAARQIFGYTEAEMDGNSATVLMGEEHARTANAMGVREMIENILAPRSGKAIYASGRRKDGSELPLRCRDPFGDPTAKFTTPRSSATLPNALRRARRSKKARNATGIFLKTPTTRSTFTTLAATSSR